MLITVAPFANGDDWKFTPSLELKEDYTSNLDLTATDEESSFITQVLPGFTLTKQGSHLDVNVSYNLQYVDYSSSQGDDATNHLLNAAANSELIDDHLFLDVRASASQQLTSNRNASNGGSVNSSGSYTDTTTFELSPYWQHRISEDMTAGVRLTYSEVNFDEPATSGSTATSDTSGLDFKVFTETHSSSQKIHWGINLDSQRSDLDQTSDNESENIDISVGYRHSAQLDTTLTYGYVDNHLDDPTDSTASAGDFWGLSVDWAPSPRTNLSASYNSKLQSANDYGLSFFHRKRHSTWTVNYTEGITSVRQSLLSNIQVGSLICNSDGSNCTLVRENNPILTEDQLAFAVNVPTTSLINDRFIQKKLTANVVVSKGKSTYSLGFFSTDREFQTGSAPAEQDIGINLSWAIQLNSRSRASVSYNWSELEPDGLAKDTVNGLSLNLSKALGSKTTVNIALNASDRSSDDSSREFSEQSVGIGLIRNF
ncbi:hypothetical protein BGP75_24390 [Motiliproteus sp. MSK22-1]|nr:hypothetical protein BGP75_24390 [Motiliproteus sp. MSK22-1]